MSDNFIMINGIRIALKVTEIGESSAGKTKLKAEGEDKTGNKFFGTFYVSAHGPVEDVTLKAQLEEARKENAKLKGKAPKEAQREAPLFDTTKRLVTSDGGTKAPPAKKSMEDLIADAVRIAMANAKLA